MILSKTVLFALVSLVYIGKVATQITATLPWVPDDGPDGDLDDFSDDDHLASGLVVGTGTAGETTYILTMTDDDDNDRPITATLVADASGATVRGAYSDEDRNEDDADDPHSVSYSMGCGIQSGNAVCTYERVGVIGSSTFTSATTRTAPTDVITLIASTGTVDAQETQDGRSASDSETASGATAMESESESEFSGARENAVAGLFIGAAPLVMSAFAMV